MLSGKTSGSFPLSTRIRCIIVDDHEMLRYGVRRLLEDAPDFEVIGEAEDAAGGVKLALEYRPDLVLLDISMPGMSPFEAGRLIVEHTPSTRVVFLTMHEDKDYLQRALASGAHGYLLKDTPSDALLSILRKVHGGERKISPKVESKLIAEREETSRSSAVSLRRNSLTVREREVMKLLAEGRTVKNAATVLGISVKTVEAHKFNLMRKLDIHNKAQLVTAAIQKKILPPPLPM